MAHQAAIELQSHPATRTVGRPKAITPEVVHKLVDSLRQGSDITTACILSGISTSTYYNELTRNKRFMDKMTIAQQETSLYAHTLVAKAIEQGDLKTARWWIDRQDRLAAHAQRVNEYRNTKKITITETHQKSHSVSMEVE